MSAEEGNYLKLVARERDNISWNCIRHKNMKCLTWLLDSASILTRLTTTRNILQMGFWERLWVLLMHSVFWPNILKIFTEKKIHCATEFCGALWRALQYQYNKLSEITAVLITARFKKMRLVFRFSKIPVDSANYCMVPRWEQPGHVFKTFVVQL